MFTGLDLDDHLVSMYQRMADWAQKIFWLWTLVPFNLQRIMEYNEKQADVAPHCSICQLFVSDPVRTNNMSANSLFPSLDCYTVVID